MCKFTSTDICRCVYIYLSICMYICIWIIYEKVKRFSKEHFPPAFIKEKKSKLIFFPSILNNSYLTPNKYWKIWIIMFFVIFLLWFNSFIFVAHKLFIQLDFACLIFLAWTPNNHFFFFSSNRKIFWLEANLFFMFCFSHFYEKIFSDK